ENNRTVGDMRRFIFCDDGFSEHQSDFIHTQRYPANLGYQKGKDFNITPVETYGILHFAAVNWRNMRIKQAWYRCLEHIRLPDQPTALINKYYDSRENKKNGCCLNSAPSWFAYPFFNRKAYEAPEQWREKEILSWFSHYGKDFFADLDIWDIDWGTGINNSK
ncbi:MAG: hypothetical protein U1E02_44825, partial [Hydrogenophaga sp.]|nr:hypothetical protein [Hydrogenophaga sp.]